jgi:hypothetical protein
MELRLSALNMDNGPYDTDEENINSLTEEKLGNYALGYTSETKGFTPKYVGRGNVHDRLIAHLSDEYYQPMFKFSYAKNEKEAYTKECKNYHDFKNQLLNKEHPKLPKDIKCPYCSHVGIS